MMISAERFPMMTSAQVDADINSAVRHEDVISDAAALTIASYWMSPGSEGAALSELVHTGRADHEALSADVTREIKDAAIGWESTALRMLLRWIEVKTYTVQAEARHSQTFDVE
jgi:hypothetical protein